MTTSECFICKKHQDFASYAGEPILERGGWIVGHFPIIEGAPATRGHLILEPKRHITDIVELSDEEASAMGGLLKEATRLVKEKLGVEHVYVFRINDQVPHLHFHLVPRYPGTPREAWGFKIWDWAGAPKIGLEDVRSLSRTLAGKV
jgi:diadenosine tetraphosphate (Ap4A) HIT family hydrolase